MMEIYFPCLYIFVGLQIEAREFLDTVLVFI